MQKSMRAQAATFVQTTVNALKQIGNCPHYIL